MQSDLLTRDNNATLRILSASKLVAKSQPGESAALNPSPVVASLSDWRPGNESTPLEGQCSSLRTLAWPRTRLKPSKSTAFPSPPPHDTREVPTKSQDREALSHRLTVNKNCTSPSTNLTRTRGCHGPRTRTPLRFFSRKKRSL